ncbi:hypothetical protein ACJ73_10145 [Blastomyces percursus]|uniref:CCHC-type domain-containing protein n=1 Tax=Blastomyces percursus TaxID=1658174 RepID=A0A1J9P0D6_9EURO|nr:hypothetical protein ACJ73_10145 [Blastomyces percursus]
MKISLLKKALSFELLKALVSVEEADVYEAFCVQLRRIDDRLTKLKSVRSASGRRSSPATSPPLVRRDPDIMDWEESNTYAQATRASAVRSSYRVPGLTLKEVTDRRRRGVCINCERSGHIAADCKFDFVPPTDKRRVRVNHATVGGELRLRKGRSRKGPEAGERLAPAKIRRQKSEEVGRQQFEDKMMMDAILVPAMIDNKHNINAMVDSGLSHYAMIKSSVVRRLNLQRTRLPKPRPLAGFDGPRDTSTRFMVRFALDVGGHRRENVYAFEVDNLNSDLMLGISWLAEQGILLDARNRTLIFPNRDRIHESDVHNTMELGQISANACELLRESSRRNRTNVRRDPAEQYKIGDSVSLNLKNMRTLRPSRTLDYRYAKYKVMEVLGSHNYRLDTPPGIHNVFHTSLLRRAITDPFPSQRTPDCQPPGILGEHNELEWEIEKILAGRSRGRGRQRLVKWVAYDRPSWTAGSALAETAALDRWEALRRGRRA